MNINDRKKIDVATLIALGVATLVTLNSAYVAVSRDYPEVPSKAEVYKTR